MPLLRQALYAQNVNLYLAPTADGRDAWLSLLRTVGCEGRCFVMSANMCIPDKPVGPAFRSEYVVARRETDASPEGRRRTQRRRSCAITDDGFEVALPTPDVAAASPTRTRRTRRKSVLDEDGNEIVLCCDEEPRKEPEPVTEEDEVADDVDGMDLSPRQRPKVGAGRKRRKSVFDADGNEIVLCCDEDGTTNGTTRTTARGGTKTTARVAAPGFGSRGGSAIVSPFGDIVAGPQWDDDENITWADVDFEDCIRGRLDLDVGGSYARNDSFKFSVEGLDLSPLPY